MNKMVINHLGKLFITSDAATIIEQLDVEHPAANMLVQASQMQEQEVGASATYAAQVGHLMRYFSRHRSAIKQTL